MKKLWITLRRVMALAELIGLPRAALRSTTSRLTSGPSPNETAGDDVGSQRAAALWKSICSIDRLMGKYTDLTTLMLFRIPGTIGERVATMTL